MVNVFWSSQLSWESSQSREQNFEELTAGLRWAWEKGFRRVELQMDSRATILILLARNGGSFVDNIAT
ncbi:hypothetical protein LINPERPRIM_LOCUS11586 [Linum perenne]